MKIVDFYIIIIANMRIRFFDYDDTIEINSVYQRLMPYLDGYEMFDTPPAFAAYEDGKPVALATLLILPKNAAIPGSDNDSSLEAELTLFVLPKYRRMGLAKELSCYIKEYTDEYFPGVPVVYTLPSALLDSSFARYPAINEMIMQIMPDKKEHLTPRKNIKDLLTGKGFVISENKHEDVLCISLLESLSVPETSDKELFDQTKKISERQLDKTGNRPLPDIAHVFINRDGCIACLYGLLVNPGYRRLGIGQMLTEYGISYFLDDNIPVILNVRDTNISAVNLYKRIGFTAADSCKYFKLT